MLLFRLSTKKSYAKMYRAKLTTYEQALFFFNSMSSLGKPWREKKENKKYLLFKFKTFQKLSLYLNSICSLEFTTSQTISSD